MKFLRKSDKAGHRLADIQARIFAQSSLEQISSLYFIRAFMRSDDVVRIDDLSFFFGNISEQEVYANVKFSMGKKSGGTLFSKEEMHWIGYFYRMMAYMTGIWSRLLVDMVPPRYLQGVYPMYHSLDIVAAIERVYGDLGLKQETDDERLKRIIRETSARV